MFRGKKPTSQEGVSPTPIQEESKKSFFQIARDVIVGEKNPGQSEAEPDPYRSDSRQRRDRKRIYQDEGMPQAQWEAWDQRPAQPEPAVRQTDRLIAGLTAAQQRLTLLEGELQADERSLLRYHTVCRRCTQPLQMVFGFCDGLCEEPADAAALAQDFQTVFLSPLMASLQNCGIAVESVAEGVKLSLPAAQDAPQGLSGEPPQGEELLRKQSPKLLQEQLDDLLEREQALRQRLDQLRRAYEPYRQICLACCEPLEELLHAGLWSLARLLDSGEALQCIRRSAKALETSLNAMGITLARYEDVAGNPEERGRFSIVEHGYVYPAVYWRGDFFFEAVGQTTVDRAAGAGSC